MKKYDLIIFDLIDTLAYCEGLSEYSAHLEEVLGKETIDAFIDRGNIDIIPSVEEALAKFRTIVPLNTEHETLVREWLSWSQSYLFDDAIETLTHLKNEGYLVGVISNSPPCINDQLLDLGIKQYVDEALFSFEVGSRKPEKEIFTMLLSRMGVTPARALMVGDSIKNDINGARAVGIDALLLDRDNGLDFNPKITRLSKLKDFLEST